MDAGETKDGFPQLRRGVIEYCVLALVRDEPRYGFDLVRLLSAAEGLLTSEGTIYPLLARLRRDGLVSTTWQESDAGPPRKYYAATPSGSEALSAFTADWRRFRDSVDTILGTPSNTRTAVTPGHSRGEESPS